LLIIATTTQIFLINAFVTPYYRSQVQNWQSYLALETLERDETFSIIEYWIFKISDLREQVKYTTTQYYALNTTSVEDYKYFMNDTNSIRPVSCEVKFYKGEMQIFDPTKRMDRDIVTQHYNLTQHYFGPFQENDQTLHDFVHKMRSFSLTFEVKTEGKSGGTCWVNRVVQNFDFEDRGRVDMKVQPDLVICPEELDKPLIERDIFPVFVTFIILFLFSILSQVLLFKAICNHMKLYQHFKSNVNSEEWEALSCKAKMRFFNFWFFITSFGNVANIIASLIAYNFLTQYSDFQWQLIILLTGFGCMMCWISIIQYLEFFPKYYYLILTLRLSTPRLAKFMIGVLPVYMGFVFFGVAYFAAFSDLFKDPDAASVTLFALLNGDVIHDVFDAIYDASPVISRVYLYSFIMLFIYAVLNIFIAIVEDAFFAAKRYFVEDLKKDMEDRNKRPQDMDILGLLEGPPVQIRPDESSEQAQLYGYTSMPFMSKVTMMNLLDDPEINRATMENQFDHLAASEDREVSSLHGDLTGAEVVETLHELHRSYNDAILNDLRDLASEYRSFLRPPHAARHFPCGDDSCIYCRIKQVFAKHLDTLRTQTKEEFKLVREFREQSNWQSQHDVLTSPMSAPLLDGDDAQGDFPLENTISTAQV